jgi:peptidoglycan/LPS O-acetylase OafA/YrhL
MQEFASSPAQAHPKALLGKQFPTLTGFRGLCILWVVFVHMPLELPIWLENPTSRWGIGVDLFLAISGFLVTRSLYQSHQIVTGKGGTGLQAAKEFLIRRVSRIFPPYFALLAIIAALALLIDRNLHARLVETSAILWSFPLFFSNYTIPLQPNVPTILNGTWSLGFQEQFYFILVLFYLLSPSRFRHLVLYAGLFSLVTRLATVLFVWGEGSHTAHLEMWLHLRFDAITWSCLAWVYYDELGALWKTPGRARLANAGVFLALCAVLAGHSFFPGDLAQAITYCFKGPVLALVVRAVCQTDASQALFPRFLRWRPIGRVGVAAYEIYLVNAMVIAALMKLKLNTRMPLLFVALCFVCSVIAGRIAYETFGKRSQEWMKAFLRGKSRTPKPVVAA